MSYPRNAVAKLRHRDGDDCAICGEPIDFTLPPSPAPQRSMNATIDHRVSRADGGRDSLANLQLAHGRCNQRKGPRSWPAA